VQPDTKTTKQRPPLHLKRLG